LAEDGVTKKTRTLVVVSHTHWDREWYQPFEEFRARLVRMMDSLLDLLERDPEYRHFVLDGQTVPLDDYLEIRPDRRPQIQRLVREGRLLAGPNYILPDEFLIGGEAHIRNLMSGIRSARAYGRPMMVGYAPDAFGHIAHLPAILRGFGIDSVLIWRGVGPEATTSEFRWQAPDGSEVLAVHFPYGYGMLAAMPEQREALAEVLRSVRSMLEPLATTRFVLVPNGTDHLPAHTGLSNVIRTANEILDDAEVVHGDYPMFVANVRRELGEEGYQDLPVLKGEFRNSKRSNILAGVLSTRIWLKQRYQHCEDLLARYAEPAVAWASLLDLPPPPAREARGEGHLASTRGLLRQAWKQLLQNGPHDSVTGCSVDAVYDDVAARFSHVEQLGESLLFEAQRKIAEAAAPTKQDCAVVFNYEHGPRRDFCTIRLPVDSRHWPSHLIDTSGRSLPLQPIQRGGYSPLDPRERVTFGFVARDVPAFGYRALPIRYAGPALGARPDSPPDAPAIDNDFFHLTVDPSDGTLTLEDTRSGRRFAGLNRFVDGGEAGDEYTYDPPERDEFIDTPSAPVDVRVTESGPARWTIEARMSYALPAGLTDDRKGRSPEPVECTIVTRASLYPGVARVDIETEVQNNARDHRLRVHFPTGIRASRSCAEQHFGIVERPIGLPDYDGTWLETPVAFYPQKTFVDISDGHHGLMLANRGLPEYEALTDAGGNVTVALTLLRCVEWLSRPDLKTRRGHAGPGMHTPGAQMPGRWRFQYCLIPHEGGWENAFQEAHNFARPMRAIRTSRGRGELPPAASLVHIDPPQVILSTLKVAEDDNSIIARVYNIGRAPAEAHIALRAPVSAVDRVDMNEERPQLVSHESGEVRLHLNTSEIATLRFERTTNDLRPG